MRVIGRETRDEERERREGEDEEYALIKKPTEMIHWQSIVNIMT